MAETKETLDGNWYKAAMGLRYTKDGLQQFVTDEIDKFHKNVLQNFSPNDQCNTCTIQNVLTCPTPGTCGRPCNFHDNTDPTKRYTRCPENICGVIRDKVKDSHRYGRQTFKNSDPQVWFNNSWELAKCFMPPGYSNSTTADDSDFSGLINVILCHLDFQAFITEDLNQDGNKFEKARKARNEIMHSPKMELSTNEMNRHFQLLIDVLSDQCCLQSLPKAQKVIQLLKKLQQDSVTITVQDKEKICKEYFEEVKKVIYDAVAKIKEKATESIETIYERTSEGTEKIDRKTNDSTKQMLKEKEILVERLRETVEKSFCSLKSAATDLTSEFKTALHEEIEMAKGNIEDMKKEVEFQKQSIKTLVQSSLDRINDETKKGIKAIQKESAKGPDQMVKDYKERKENLQKELIDHYFQNGYCKSAIPALIDDEEVDVADIFDMPKMRIKQSSSKDLGSQRAEYRDIKTIFEIFQTERERILRACISGEAGYGKTTLCQKILSNWCKLHTNQQIKSLQSDDQKFLKSFDFLFYIPLRNHTTPDIVEMIKAELVRRDMHDILDEVLQRDSCKCFIILDGLDEWSLHEDCGKRIHVPIFDKREKTTVLITSRPWKLEVLRPKNREIGHEVELCGITDRNKCIMAVVDYLNKNRGEKKTWKNIFKKEQFRYVRNLLQVPTLLTQIVCMWYDDMDFGKTRVEVYCRMIEYYLQMANKRQKHTTKQNSYEFSRLESRKTENDCLLDSFRDLPFCEKYIDLLSKLSELAFCTLFSVNKEASLVFPHSITKIHKLNEVDLNFCLKAGLLSQARFCGKVTLQSKKLSFIHKTVQEFLAAVFIAHNDNKFKEFLLKQCAHEFEMGGCMSFLSGLRPDMIYDMSKHIADLRDKDERVATYRKSVNDDDDDDDDYVLYDHGKSIFYVEENYRHNKEDVVNSWFIPHLLSMYPGLEIDETYEGLDGLKLVIIKNVYIGFFEKKKI